MKLISLNIERSNHIKPVEDFLRGREHDVVCLLELMERDIPVFEEAAGKKCIYSPGTIHDAEGNPGVMGIGIFSTLPVVSTSVHRYSGTEGHTPTFDFTDAATKHATENLDVLFADFQMGGSPYRVGLTHFTWTPKGEADDFQRQDMRKLLSILETSGEFVLCGDFNAPRVLDGKPGETYSTIAAKYKDNVPEKYVTSLDVNLHRAGKARPHEIDNKMVDYIFSTPAYAVSDVELVFGVSDHAAVVANISKTLS